MSRERAHARGVNCGPTRRPTDEHGCLLVPAGLEFDANAFRTGATSFVFNDLPGASEVPPARSAPEAHLSKVKNRNGTRSQRDGEPRGGDIQAFPAVPNHYSAVACYAS
jgi:hypothetical protein